MRDPHPSRTLNINRQLEGRLAFYTDANLLCWSPAERSISASRREQRRFLLPLRGVLGISRAVASATIRPDFVSVGSAMTGRKARTEAHFRPGPIKTPGAHVIPWTRHVRTGRDTLLRALEIANQSGALTFAGYSCVSLKSNFLAAGDPLRKCNTKWRLVSLLRRGCDLSLS